MPTYLYKIVNDNGTEGPVFEIYHGMNETLRYHPKTGQPIKRIYTVPAIAHRYTPGHTRRILTPENLSRKGFTRYERDKHTGVYHRTAGQEGPPLLRKE
ncbi:MAG: hypothetical protein LBR62_02995 [Puniceicoccales bacterium]|nr:hypothetical protein [Puniceicoccales bacterium]